MQRVIQAVFVLLVLFVAACVSPVDKTRHVFPEMPAVNPDCSVECQAKHTDCMSSCQGMTDRGEWRCLDACEYKLQECYDSCERTSP